MFDWLHNKMVLSKLDCMASVNIWKETVAYHELTINKCQKDAKLCLLLDKVQCSYFSEESIVILRGRVVAGLIVNQFRELEELNQSPVCLPPKRKPCDEFNNAMLSSLESKVIEIACTNTVDKMKEAHKWTQKAAKELEKLNRDSNLMAGLENCCALLLGYV